MATWHGRTIFTLLVVASALACPNAKATPINASYGVSLSISARVISIRNSLGNTLTGVPNDLAITGRVFDITGFGFFSDFFAANTPAAYTNSSFSGTGDVIQGNIPRGDGPIPLSVGDGVNLAGAASGSIHDLPQNTNSFVSSDVSQSGELKFSNNSMSNAYSADVLVSWTFHVTGDNSTAPGPDGLRTDVGYVLYLGRRTEGTGSNFFYFEDTEHFHSIFPGQTVDLTGGSSFTANVAIDPGEAPIFTILPFVGGVGGPVDMPGATSAWTPEPSTFVMLGSGLVGLLFFSLHRRFQ